MESEASDLKRFFDGIAWLSQIVLFLMLGLLVQPRSFPMYFVPAIAAAAILMFIARLVAVFACLLPFLGVRETTFASWVGLRGTVPIYLSILPALADPCRDAAFFAGIFSKAEDITVEEANRPARLANAMMQDFKRQIAEKLRK